MRSVARAASSSTANDRESALDRIVGEEETKEKKEGIDEIKGGSVSV